MLGVIVRGFANVARFSGRDTRGQFWPYAAVAVALYFVGVANVVTPIVWSPAETTPDPAADAERMALSFLLVASVSLILVVVLLAAAVVRRLHDSGRSAFWGLLPLPFLAFSGVIFSRLVGQFGREEPDLVLFLAGFLSNILYLIGVVVLIVMLARPSDPGENRYGELTALSS